MSVGADYYGLATIYRWSFAGVVKETSQGHTLGNKLRKCATGR
jgi:hypothetical protein